MINEIITPATRHTLYLNEVISYKPLATRAISAGFGYVLKIFKATDIQTIWTGKSLTGNWMDSTPNDVIYDVWNISWVSCRFSLKPNLGGAVANHNCVELHLMIFVGRFYVI